MASFFSSCRHLNRLLLVPVNKRLQPYSFSKTQRNISYTGSHKTPFRETMESVQKIAVIQLNCKSNKEENFKIAERSIIEAANNEAKMVFLPECTDYIASNHKELNEQCETLDGDIVTRYRNLAKSRSVWLSLCIHQRESNEISEKNSKSKILNAHIIIDNEGEIKSIYHKLHLFNLEIPGVVRLLESEHFQPGSKMVRPVEGTPVGKIGLAICYDLRFPELAIAYGKSGVDMITYPASFTKPTGKYHWKPLLQARAIENQCYVVAAAQAGVHNQKRGSYGHSMVVSPTGEVVMEIDSEDDAGIGYAMIDFRILDECRKKLPIWKDRRTDVYADILPADKC